MSGAGDKRMKFWFYTTKVIAGTILGIFFGLFSLWMPVTIAIMILVLAAIIVIFWLIGLRDHILKLVLRYGTFSYFITIIAFWALIYNITT